MRYNIFNTFLAAMLAVSAVSLASCVKENFEEECPPDVRLLIKTDQDTGRYGTRADSRARNVEEWYDSIDSIDVYIFDENEKFVTLWKGGPYTPGVDYEVPLREIGLMEGVYTFVAWTNSDDNHDDDSGYHYYSNFGELMSALGAGEPTEDGENPTNPQVPEPNFTMGDMQMHMKHPEDRFYDDNSESFPHRHHGILEKAYVSENSILAGGNILEIFPSIHKVNFTIIDLNSNPLSSRSVTVVDRNVSHDFLNSYIYGDDYRVRRHLSIAGAGESETPADETAPPMSASMYLMQLNDDTGTNVEIHSTDDPKDHKLVYEVPDLVHIIKTVYVLNNQPLDFDETLEFNVTIEIGAKTHTTFIVNGWRYDQEHIDMGGNPW